jgi:hypothetical protein
MAGEKTDFEKGLEAIEREAGGGMRNENEGKAMRDLEDKPQRPEIFERVHERYLEEDAKGHFIKEA